MLSASVPFVLAEWEMKKCSAPNSWMFSEDPKQLPVLKSKTQSLNLFIYFIYLLQFKTESAGRWSNKWTKTLYQDYLHCIANFFRALSIIFSKQFISSNTKRRKRMLNFVWNTYKFWWNETDDEIVPVFAQNHWTLKFIFSRSREKLFFGVISGNCLCI